MMNSTQEKKSDLQNDNVFDQDQDFTTSQLQNSEVNDNVTDNFDIEKLNKEFATWVDIEKDEEDLPADCYKSPTKVKFHGGPIQQFLTYSKEDYERHLHINEDPLDEMEERIANMEIVIVNLDLIGDSSIQLVEGFQLEEEEELTFGVYVGSVPDSSLGVVVGDLLVCLDGQDLLGETAAKARNILREKIKSETASKKIEFVLARRKK